MAPRKPAAFNLKTFLAHGGKGRSISKYRKNAVVFSQGEPADAVFFVQKGKVKVGVVSNRGKEAVVSILGPGDFFGEGSVAGQALRIATVAAMTDAVIVRIARETVVQLMREELAFSEMFMIHVLKRNVRVEADLD
jgi:CRP/FNR family cyclic AMP-dependent transcriptional regulator